MRPIATDVARSVVCVPGHALDTWVSCAKRVNRSRCRLGQRLVWLQGTVQYKRRSRSDESIRSRKGRLVGDAAFCPNYFGHFLLIDEGGLVELVVRRLERNAGEQFAGAGLSRCPGRRLR